MLRSLLFVPGDSDRKLARAGSSSADALILDLEDSVAPQRKPVARQRVAEFLAGQPASRDRGVWVRINPSGTPDAALDLEGFGAGPPDGIVLPKASPVDVGKLAQALGRLEDRRGWVQGKIAIIPLATETPASFFTMGGYSDEALRGRLAGVSWGAEDLSVALGALTNVDERGEWLFTYRLARSLCLVAAHAAGVVGIDTIYRDFRDLDGLRRSAAAARRDGFSGKLAIHPDQVEAINEAFHPTDEEIAYARRVVQAFENAPEAGVVALDDRMLDRPHLARAERVLALATRDTG